MCVCVRERERERERARARERVLVTIGLILSHLAVASAGLGLLYVHRVRQRRRVAIMQQQQQLDIVPGADKAADENMDAEGSWPHMLSILCPCAPCLGELPDRDNGESARGSSHGGGDGGSSASRPSTGASHTSSRPLLGLASLSVSLRPDAGAASTRQQARESIGLLSGFGFGWNPLRPRSTPALSAPASFQAGGFVSVSDWDGVGPLPVVQQSEQPAGLTPLPPWRVPSIAKAHPLTPRH